MRISTAAFYEQSQKSLGLQQTNLLRVQQQMGAMTKILSPSDDPISATRALGVSQSLALNTQYAASRSMAIQSLSLEESALQSVTTVLQDIKVLVIQAGNGSLTDTDRASIATALESSLNQLQGLANTDDGNGQYLFAGFKSSNPPFVRQADGSMAYVGDQGQRLMQVDVSRQMAATDDGRSIFQTVQSGAGYITSAETDVFGAIGDIVKAIRNPIDADGTGVGRAHLLNALSTANRKMTNAHDNVLTVRASIGSRLQELDALNTTGGNRMLLDKSHLSELQDLDYASAIAEFYQRQTALEATQKVFVKIQGMSLFNYL